jgi:hypothetical protein
MEPGSENSASENWVSRQDEAIACARSHPDRNMREAMLFAIGLGVGSLLGEEQRFCLAECVPRQRLDFLLCVRLVRHLLERHDRVGRILAGDYRDDWLPPELQDLCDDKG